LNLSLLAMALLRELVFCPGFPKAHEFAFSVTVVIRQIQARQGPSLAMHSEVIGTCAAQKR
jgi:hypothetical protein